MKHRTATILFGVVLTGAAVVGITRGTASRTTGDWTVKEAEQHAITALDRLECNKTNPGSAAEAWAEANSTMPHGFEIIAQCAGKVAP
jgi:hypothetical protein